MAAMRKVVKSERKPGRYHVTFSNGTSAFIDGPDRFIDTLECGHTVERYTRAERRKCEQCK